MKCIYCNSTETKVTDSVKANRSVLRKRVCSCCGKGFYTEEKVGATIYEQNGIREQLKRLREINKERNSARGNMAGSHAR